MIPSEAQIRAILTGPVKKTGSHLICTCWECNKELKYYYNINNGFSDCKSCSKGHNLYQFLQGWGALDLLQGEQVNVSSDLKRLDALQTGLVETLEIPDCKLPPGFKKITWEQENKFTVYLRERKYTLEDFLLYQPGYTDLVEKLEGYVVVPIYRNWVVKGYIARNVLDDDRLRYQNKKGVKFSKLLDGIDDCTTNTETAIITEGHFDKVSVTTELKLHEQESFKALASFGKKLTISQMELLQQTNVKNLYFLYDMKDAINQIKQFGSALKRKFNVYGCYAATNLDAGQMQAKQLLTLLQQATPIENYTRNYVQLNALKS
jgi:hypothetical protein